MLRQFLMRIWLWVRVSMKRLQSSFPAPTIIPMCTQIIKSRVQICRATCQFFSFPALRRAPAEQHWRGGRRGAKTLTTQARSTEDHIAPLCQVGSLLWHWRESYRLTESVSYPGSKKTTGKSSRPVKAGYSCPQRTWSWPTGFGKEQFTCNSCVLLWMIA